MNSFRDIAEAFSRWIDRVAATILAGWDSFRPPRRLRLIERKDGLFAVEKASQQPASDLALAPFAISDGRIEPAASTRLTEILRGAEVELVLQSKRFVFRPLELPRRATDFLEGIVRAQIDRLTPWSAADAAFGWLPPAEGSSERMVVTVAATARALIAPFAAAIASLGVDAIIVSAGRQGQSQESDLASITVFEQRIKSKIETPRVRRALIWLLAAAGALAAAGVAANIVIGGDIETRQEDLTRRIGERRAAIQPGHDRTSEAAHALERRKHEAPSTVIVVEALSRILPDDTYLSELRILGDKIQIVGVTSDAPTLIRLIEQIPHFTRATFFAPTTRSPSAPGEHFFIEAHIEPVYKPSP